MKKFIKLTLLLLISFSVNSKNLCTSDCPLKKMIEANLPAKKPVEAKLKATLTADASIDENDWILNTRFKY